jgi:hypothetical protein
VPQRALAATIVAMLVVGFFYSGTATIRFYRATFAQPAGRGSNATIDNGLRVVNLNGKELRAAIERAGWLPDAAIVVLGAVSSVSAEDLTEVYYSASYLLYPRPVWLASWCDEEAAPAECLLRHALPDPMIAATGRHAHDVMVVGPSNPFVHASSEPLSNRLNLVELE